MKNYISINGKILPEEKAKISVKDRGFRFGDGVFETCLIKDGVVYNLEAHLDRLEAGLRAVKILFSYGGSSCRPFRRHPDESRDPFYNKVWIPTFVGMTREVAMKEEIKIIQKLIQKNKIKNGYLRIAVSRGVGSIGYLPQKNIQPTVVIETLTLNPKPKSLIKLFVSEIQKPSLKSFPVNYKLMQGLNSTLVKLEAVENGCFDGIILNAQGQICETSSANIFWVKDNILHTPHQDCGCLLGTVREKILELSPIKTKLVKAKITDLLKADEVFITNVAIGVLAIDKIADKEFKNKNYIKVFANLLDKDIKKYVKNATN
jgi:branched-chain amino acid aminotransferase